jgi:hypothetical protein
VFQVINDAAHDLPHYLAQIIIFGPDMGRNSTDWNARRARIDNELMKNLVRQSKPGAEVEFPVWGLIPYPNALHGFKRTLLDGSEHPAYSCELMFADTEMLDRIETPLCNLHRGLGMDPDLPDATRAMLQRHKESVMSVEYMRQTPLNWRAAQTKLHDVLKDTLNECGKMYVRAVTSTNPMEKDIVDAMTWGSALYKNQVAEQGGVNSNMKLLNGLFPGHIFTIEAGMRLRGTFSHHLVSCWPATCS